MNSNSRARVLAVGIDAAEPKLVLDLMGQGLLPTLKGLASEGQWLRVDSPAHIGSGAVWPSFISGEDASEHGIYGEWCWQPKTMGIARFQGRHLTPFWEPLVRSGLKVGVLD